MAPENQKATPIRSIKAHQLNYKITVRVGRIWRPKKYDSEDYDGLHYILIDENGDTIEAIIEEEYCDYVTEKMKEGEIYNIYKFHNRRDPFNIRVTNHPIQLLFNRYTIFEPAGKIVPSPPRYGFHLLEFHEFTAQLDKQDVYADIYGCIKHISHEYEVFVPEKKKMVPVRNIVLANLRREELQVSLWGDIRNKIDVKAVDELPSATFAVITSLKATNLKGEIIARSTNHTCIFINPHVDNEEEYKAEFSKPGDKVRVSKQEMSRGREMKTVTQLYELDPKTYKESQKNVTFPCKASIARYLVQKGWWYKRCSSRNCFKELKENKDSTDLICKEHGVQTPLPWYRASMVIQDDENETTVTLMGAQAEQLFGSSCENLLNKTPHEALPQEIQNTIGQTHVFELGFNNYGYLLVKGIVSDQIIPKPATELHPATETPKKMSERKREIDGTAKALFASEPQKKSKRQNNEGTSSSPTKELKKN